MGCRESDLLDEQGSTAIVFMLEMMRAPIIGKAPHNTLHGPFADGFVSQSDVKVLAAEPSGYEACSCSAVLQSRNLPVARSVCAGRGHGPAPARPCFSISMPIFKHAMVDRQSAPEKNCVSP